ncbi:hypothetical protein [Alysiella crassa]|nr:hypothetical protein [Alysiella crassa]
MILSLGLAACATQSAPQTATAPQYNAAALVGKWHCHAQFEENMDYAFDIDYHADGTSRDKGILTVRLSEKDLVWQFEAQTQSKWRIDGAYFFEQQAAKPIVKLLPIENKNTRRLLKAFEKSNPEVLEMKKELLDSLSKFDDEAFRGKIMTLNDKLFQVEVEIDDMKVMRTCQRR